MELQAILDKVAKHLLKQNAQSKIKTIGPDGYESVRCLYRGPENLSCAVGCLILEENYHVSLEGEGVDSLEVQNALIASGVENTDGTISLLRRLQDMHDCNSVREWPFCLEQIASDFDLTPYPTEQKDAHSPQA